MFTASGRALAEAFRRDQLAIRARLIRRVIALWPLLDSRRLDATAPVWLDEMVPEIVRHRRESGYSAARFFEQYRQAELPDDPPVRARWLDDNPDTDENPIRASLVATGPASVKAASVRLAGLDDLETEDRLLGEEMRKASTKVAGAAARHALNGGREVLREEGARDPAVLAFARVSDGDPCWFCALMISRGFVYRNADTAGRDANDKFVGDGLYKFHDRCACTIVPVLDRDTPPTAQAAQYRAVYDAAKKAARESGDDVKVEFRRLMEGRKRPTKAAGSDAKTRAARRSQVKAEPIDRRKIVEAQIEALEPTFQSLTERLAAGEPVQGPHEYQKNLLGRLRTELAGL